MKGEKEGKQKVFPSYPHHFISFVPPRNIAKFKPSTQKVNPLNTMVSLL
jgi:hypothetical protein